MGGGTYARKIPNAVAFGPGQEQKSRQARTSKRTWKHVIVRNEAELFENLKKCSENNMFLHLKN